MAPTAHDVEEVKRQLDSFDCPCSRGQPDSCPLPLFVKDCACWYDRHDQCKALVNGRYDLVNGVKCPRYGDDLVFDANHPHRRSPLQDWALSNRHDPFAALPQNLRHWLQPVNGKDDIFFGQECARDLSRRSSSSIKRKYIDPRSGFDYGKWPVKQNGVSVRDPAECVIKRTILEEVQKELDRAGLTDRQQMLYYTAALEVQKGLPPSFSYHDIFKSDSTAPRARVSLKRGAAAIDGDGKQGQGSRPAKRNQPLAPERPHAWESAVQGQSRTEQVAAEMVANVFGEAQPTQQSRDGFPFHGMDDLIVPHPEDFHGQGGIQNLTAVRHYGFGRLGQMMGLERAGLTKEQVRVYMQAADESRDGELRSFDYSTILSGRASPVIETRERIPSPPAVLSRRQTRAVTKRLRQLDDEGEEGQTKRARVTRPSRRSKRAEAPAKVPARAAAKEEPLEESEAEKRGRPRRTKRVDYAALHRGTTPQSFGPRGVKRPLLVDDASPSPPAKRSNTGVSRRVALKEEDNLPQNALYDEPVPSIEQVEPAGPRRSARVKGETPASEGVLSRTGPARSIRRRARPQATAAAPATAPAPAIASVPANAGTTNNGGFVSAMASGFDRNVWSHRPGIGRYPAYITKKGVKHMNDACKYIDNGRLLGRPCHMNNNLQNPFPARDLFIAKDGKRCSYCTSKNFGPKQCDNSYVGKPRKNNNRHN